MRRQQHQWAAAAVDLRRRRRALEQRERRAANRTGAAEVLAAAVGLQRAPPAERAEGRRAYLSLPGVGGRFPGGAGGRDVEPGADGAVAAPPDEAIDAVAAEAVAAATPAARGRAVAYCVERELAAWVASVNGSSGVAPSTATVWQVRSGLRANSATPLEAVAQCPGWVDRRALQWVRRWRNRLRLRRGRPRPATVLPAAELRRKARRSSAESVPGAQFRRAGGSHRGKKGGRIPSPRLAWPERADPFQGPPGAPQKGFG